MRLPGACAGIRVLDVSRSAAGSLATMVLADYGADVVRVDEPGATPHLLLDRGKRSVTADQEARDRLLPGVDVVVTDEPGDDLLARHPHLVIATVDDADDWLVMAKAGIFRDQPGWERDGRRPIYRSCPDATYFAGMLAVLGVLGALRARDLTGRGQCVDVDKLLAITCRQNPQVRCLRRDGEALPADQAASTETVSDAINPLAHHRDPREVTLTGMMVECRDGRWIMHSLSEPHFFPAWIDAIGFGWIWDDERFDGAPSSFPDDEAKVELVNRLTARMKEKTAAEWTEVYLANGNVCADVIQTTKDALRHPQVMATGLTVELDDPRVGPMLQLGPLAKLPNAPAEVRRPAPEPGEHTAEVLGAEVVPVAFEPTDRQLAGPLEGVTIVEAAYYYATPFATALLAELGARVIKVEPIQGDPYRRLGRGMADPVTALGHNNMVRAMQGKESIALDLKDERGREVLHRLVAGADVFVHSFRGKVPEHLGIDAATLRAVNPTLVYQYAASYGSQGPHARQPAIDPVIAAFAGQTAYQTGEGNPPLRESGADPVAAAGHAAAMALGLFARHRTGEAQDVESAMIVSNMLLNFEDAYDHEGKQPRPPVDPRQFGIGPTHRLYECAPDPGDRPPYVNPDPRWVMFVADEAAFARFREEVGRPDLAADEDELAAVFLTRTAAEWEAADVGCVVADAMSHFAFLFEDEQAKAVPMTTAVEHPSIGGRYWRYSPAIAFSDTPSQARPFTEHGEHTRALLAEVGYDADAIQALEADGVVASLEGRAVST